MISKSINSEFYPDRLLEELTGSVGAGRDELGVQAVAQFVPGPQTELVAGAAPQVVGDERPVGGSHGQRLPALVVHLVVQDEAWEIGRWQMIGSSSDYYVMNDIQ